MPDVEPAGANDGRRSGDPEAPDEGTAQPLDADDVVAYEPPVEPGTPAPENVLFFLLGVGLALAVVFRLVQLFG